MSEKSSRFELSCHVIWMNRERIFSSLFCRARCRTGGGAALRYDESAAELALSERDVLYVVDGQQRIEGVLRSDLPQQYDIPTVIIDGLSIVQEAAQFLTINSKQMRVRPDLQLRVLYNFDRVDTQRLVDVLKVDDWKLEAQAIVMPNVRSERI